MIASRSMANEPAADSQVIIYKICDLRLILALIHFLSEITPGWFYISTECHLKTMILGILIIKQ